MVTGGHRWLQEGFGTTGETYLIGPDLLLRSGGRLFDENRDQYFAAPRAPGGRADEVADIQRFDSPVLHQRVDTPAARAGVGGIEGIGRTGGNCGDPVLASWGPLDIPGLKWGLVTEVDAGEAFAPIERLQRDLTVVGGVVLLAVIGRGG